MSARPEPVYRQSGVAPYRRDRRRAWFAADRASRACAPAIRHIVSALPGKLDQLEASQP